MSSELINVEELGSHVADGTSYHLPHYFGHLDLPAINLFGYELQITKFMVVEIAVVILMFALFVPLASKIKGGKLSAHLLVFRTLKFLIALNPMHPARDE